MDERLDERLSVPLSLLPLCNSQGSLSTSTICSTIDSLTTPGSNNDTDVMINWQAAELLRKIDTNALINQLPRLAGSACVIEQIPIIKSYVNMLLLLQENHTEKRWIIRIPYRQQAKTFLLDEVEPLIRVNKKFKFRVPYLYAYGLAKDEDNKLGVDFLLLDFIDGKHMPMWTEIFPTSEQKRQVLEKIADIYLEMFSKPVTYEDRLELKNANSLDGMRSDFDTFDLPPTTTTSGYLHNLVDMALRSKIGSLLTDDALERAGELDTGTNHPFADMLTLFLMRNLIETQVIGKYNDASFYIAHPDLHNRNIIIQGRPLPEESPPSPRQRRATLTKEPLQLKSQLPRWRISSCSESPEDERLSVVGIVDWDAAHPLPLQCAAIYPKFLETLPGTEFPDLSKDYEPPDLTPEKKLFLDILGSKEYDQFGHNIVTKLIRNGSWERDFFTVALRRGNVRRRWMAWHKAQQRRKNRPHPILQDELHPDTIGRMRSGLHQFLAKVENRQMMAAGKGWDLIARIVLELDQLDQDAADSIWFPPVSLKPAALTEQIVANPQKRTLGSGVAHRIQAWEGKVAFCDNNDHLKCMGTSTPEPDNFTSAVTNNSYSPTPE